MTNPDDPAMVGLYSRFVDLTDGKGREVQRPEEAMGLTKREYFAAMAMQGLLANPNRMGGEKETSEASIWFADALIAELNK